MSSRVLPGEVPFHRHLKKRFACGSLVALVFAEPHNKTIAQPNVMLIKARI
jgi:hypothetical protein